MVFPKKGEEKIGERKDDRVIVDGSCFCVLLLVIIYICRCVCICIEFSASYIGLLLLHGFNLFVYTY